MSVSSQLFLLPLVVLVCFFAAVQADVSLLTNPKFIEATAALKPIQADVTGTPPPTWPFSWNATLAKINPDNNNINWVKFYYDWTNNSARFDFYNAYYNTEQEWQLNCSILFNNNNIWFVFPDVQACNLDHSGIGPISPWWLQSAQYNQTALFKGMYCDQWLMETDLGVISYWARSDSDNTPVRSTNQSNDPGATDYLDVILGAQDDSMFVLPEYCQNSTPLTCG